MRARNWMILGLGLLLLVGTLPVRAQEMDEDVPLVKLPSNVDRVAEDARRRLEPTPDFPTNPWARPQSVPGSTMHARVAAARRSRRLRTLAPAELGLRLLSETDGFFRVRVEDPARLAASGGPTADRGKLLWVEPREGELVVSGAGEGAPRRIRLVEGEAPAGDAVGMSPELARLHAHFVSRQVLADSSR